MNTKNSPALYLDRNKNKGTAYSKKGYECNEHEKLSSIIPRQKQK